MVCNIAFITTGIKVMLVVSRRVYHCLVVLYWSFSGAISVRVAFGTYVPLYVRITSGLNSTVETFDVVLKAREISSLEHLVAGHDHTIAIGATLNAADALDACGTS